MKVFNLIFKWFYGHRVRTTVRITTSIEEVQVILVNNTRPLSIPTTIIHLALPLRA